jgi:hypothetical protein
MSYNLTPLRLTCLFEYTWSSLEWLLKGKMNFDGKKTSTALRYMCIEFQVHLNALIAFFALIWHFWWGNEVKGATSFPVLVLNAKGREIKAKATGSANHLWILKRVELEFVFCTNDFYCKIWSLMGENFDHGKRGSFWHLINFTLTICPNKCVWLRDRKKNLIYKNKLSGGKSDPNMPKSYVSKFGLQFALFSCFLMCWYESP